MALDIERLLGLAADMQRLSPADDALTQVIRASAIPDADELSLDELELLSAAGPAQRPDAPDAPGKHEAKFSLPLDR